MSKKAQKISKKKKAKAEKEKKKALKELTEAFHRLDEEMEEARADRADNIEIACVCFDGLGWEFERSSNSVTADVKVGENDAKVTFEIRERNVARVELTFPFTCESEYRLLARDYLQDVSSRMVFGAFRMSSDGEVSIRQNFLIGDTLEPAQLNRYIDMCMNTYRTKFSSVKQYCTGCFDEEEKEKIYGRLRELIVKMKEVSA